MSWETVIAVGIAAAICVSIVTLAAQLVSIRSEQSTYERAIGMASSGHVARIMMSDTYWIE
jgi:hypothetical protein